MNYFGIPRYAWHTQMVSELGVHDKITSLGITGKWRRVFVRYRTKKTLAVETNVVEIQNTRQ